MTNSSPSLIGVFYNERLKISPAFFHSPYCDRALVILKENFLKIDQVGVRRAAEFLLGEDADTEDLQAEVVGFVNRFVEIVSRK